MQESGPRLGLGARLCHVWELAWGLVIAFGCVHVTDVTGHKESGESRTVPSIGAQQLGYGEQQRSVLGAQVYS